MGSNDEYVAFDGIDTGNLTFITPSVVKGTIGEQVVSNQVAGMWVSQNINR